MAWDEQKTRLQIFRIIRESLFVQEMRGEQDCGSEDSSSIDLGFEDSTSEACDWNAVYAEMKDHAIAFLAQKWLENGALKSGMDEALRNEWLRGCMRQQVRWIQIMGAQDRMLRVLAENQIDCVIIKGAAAAIYYPQPSLRAMGDIDFLVVVRREVPVEKKIALVETLYALSPEDGAAIRERIETRHGHRQLSYMKELGMGNNRYLLLDIDHEDARICPAQAVEGVVPFVELPETERRRIEYLKMMEQA